MTNPSVVEQSSTHSPVVTFKYFEESVSQDKHSLVFSPRQVLQLGLHFKHTFSVNLVPLKKPFYKL